MGDSAVWSSGPHWPPGTHNAHACCSGTWLLCPSACGIHDVLPAFVFCRQRGLLWPGLPSQEVAALLQEERKPARTQPLASCSSRPSSGTGNSVTKLTALAQRSSLSMGNSRFSFHTGWKEWVSSHSVRTCQGDCAWSPSPSSATELHASARPPKCCPHRSGKTE